MTVDCTQGEISGMESPTPAWVPHQSKSDSDLVAELVLRHPPLAGFLAWLIPGAGHFYQRRFAKGTLFFLCIMPIFVIGGVLGSSDEVGPVRSVYCSWREGDKRLYFIPQSCLGLSAIPAIAQSYLCAQPTSSPMRRGPQVSSPLGRWMAPPQLGMSGVPPAGDEIVRRLHVWYDLSTLFLVVAGLMNLLAIFDAIAGPVLPPVGRPTTAAPGFTKK